MFPFPTFPIIPILPQTTPTQNPLKGQYTSPVSSQKPKLKPKHAIQPPPYSLRDDLQIQYQTHAKCLYWLRIAIVFSTLAISAATVGSAARALRQQSAGMSSSSPPLPLWPANLDLRQTQTALGCGALVAVASFGFLACAFWSSVRHPDFHLPSLITTKMFLALLVVPASRTQYRFHRYLFPLPPRLSLLSHLQWYFERHQFEHWKHTLILGLWMANIRNYVGSTRVLQKNMLRDNCGE